MAIAATPPKGGIVAELGGKSRPLLLRNEEIERFEAQHDLGIFAVLDRLLGRGDAPQARHIRDVVALGLVGGGMTDRAADGIIGGLPPGQNLMLRQIAHDLVLAAFIPENPQKKSEEAGSSETPSETATDGTSRSGSKASPSRASRQNKSGE